MGNNTVMKHIERLRKMVSLAFKMEWLDKDPFMKFEAKYEKRERGFLTLEEMQSIENKVYDTKAAIDKGSVHVQLLYRAVLWRCDEPNNR
jgi:hypothetical protein